MASLMNRVATPDDVLAIVSCFAVPVPPGRPSKKTLCAPFRSKVAVVLALLIDNAVAPAAGRTVTVLVELFPAIFPTVSGYVSELLTYVLQSSRTSGPFTPFVERYENADVNVA